MTSFFAQRLIHLAVCALVILPVACREDPDPPEGMVGGGGIGGGSGGRGGTGGGRPGTGGSGGGPVTGSGGTGGSTIDAPSTPGTDGRAPEAGTATDALATDGVRPDATTATGDGVSSSAMRPFFSHPMAYPAGTIRPSNCTPAGVDAGAADAGSTGCAQATLDQSVMAFYEKWKAAYVRPITSGGCTGLTYIDAPADFGSQQAVSSLQGMGMLITVVMATGQDTTSRASYDAMFKYARRFPSRRNAALMAKDVPSGCPTMVPTDLADSQTDGDLDIALSLLMADRQWGSTGAVNYLNEAKDLIRIIKAADMNPMGLPILGDWVVATQPVGDGGAPVDPKFATGLRTSDLMPDHFRAFSAATADPFWMGAIDGSHSVLKSIQDNHSMATGLFPDFVINAYSAPAPAPANWSNSSSSNDGRYSYTAARVPLRLATDYITSSGVPADRVKAIMAKMNDWISGAKTMGNPAQIVDGYQLNGTNLPNTGGSFLFESAFGAAAVVDMKYQAWLDAIWARVSTGNTANDSHLDSVRLLSLIVMSGNWWAP